MFRNQEGYADPTAGEALARIEREKQMRIQIERSKVIRYTLAWTNPVKICSASSGRNQSDHQKK